THPTRIPANPAVGRILEPKSLQKLACDSPAPLRGTVTKSRDHTKVLAAREHLVNRRVLPRQGDALPDLFGLRPHIVPLGLCLSGVGDDESAQDADQCGLAGAVATEKTQDLAGWKGEVEAGQRDLLAVPLGKSLGADRVGGHRFPSMPRE